MWRRVASIIGKSPQSQSQGALPSLDALALGTVIQFASAVPWPLGGQKALISAIRTYRFSEETTLTYGITLNSGDRYFLAVAKDEEGFYLGVMRELSSAEQRVWFDPDALSFFTDSTSAKTLKSRVDLKREGAWAAAKYQKTVDFLEGDVGEGRHAASDVVRKPRRLQYSMLLDASGEKAIEIEVYPDHGNTRVFATVFVPEEAIAILPEATLEMDEPLELQETFDDDAHPSAEVIPIHPERMHQLAAELQEEPPLFVAPEPELPRPAKPDFKRLSEEEVVAVDPMSDDFEEAPIPAFLLEPHPQSLLDEILQPDALHVRFDVPTAHKLLARAVSERRPVREIMRELLGLQPSVRDEVIFELPLSEREKEALAMKFQLRPDREAEIKARLLEEIRSKLK